MRLYVPAEHGKGNVERAQRWSRRGGMRHRPNARASLFTGRFQRGPENSRWLLKGEDKMLSKEREHDKPDLSLMSYIKMQRL